MRPEGQSVRNKWLFKILIGGLFLFPLLSLINFGCIHSPGSTGYRTFWHNKAFLKRKVMITAEQGPAQSLINEDSKRNTSEFHFDPHGNDTLVMIHIQKTGGREFRQYLVTVKRGSEYLCNISSAMKEIVEAKKRIPRTTARWKTVSCPRYPNKNQSEQWLISEKTMGWICGVHPSYTEYHNCLPKLNSIKFNKLRKLHYAVFLRHPILRYISEYLHFHRNATWAARHKCKGKLVPLEDMPPCYPGFYDSVPWPNLNLSSFLSCESNWANNRQTLMLADMEATNCFDKKSIGKEEWERKLLESAKKNLESFVFFGITEYMDESLRMFENYFNMTFPSRLPTRNLGDLISAPMMLGLLRNPAHLTAIHKVNSLDVALYEHALKLFEGRARRMGIKINKNFVEKDVRILSTNSHPLEYKKGELFLFIFILILLTTSLILVYQVFMFIV